MSFLRENKSRRLFLKSLLTAGPSVLLGLSSARLAFGAQRSPSIADLSAVPSKIRLLRRSEWTSTEPDQARMRRVDRYDRITLHHAGTIATYHTDEQDVILDLNGMLDAHVERGYGDIGYHLIIDRAGRVWEGRSLACEGAHVTGENERNMGIVLLGNFEEQYPAAAQKEAAGRLVTLLARCYGISRDRIYGHRDLGHSLCPGAHFYPYVVRFARPSTAFPLKA